MNTYEYIIYDKKDNVATVTLNRPNYLNSLTRKMMSEIADAMEQVRTDGDVKVVVIRGAGRGFCSGAYLSEGEGLSTIQERKEIVEIIRMWGKGIGSIRNCGKPSIAAVHGYCTAGGFEIMCACDFAVATEDAQIGDFHMQRSFMAGAGAIPLLHRIVGMRKAKELVMTGRLMSGKEAYEFGLLNRLAPAGKLDETLNEFLPLLTGRTVVGLTHVKFACDSALSADLESACAIEALACTSLFCSSEVEEMLNAFVEKREPKQLPGINWSLSHGGY